jgi:hypothetical protein
VTAESALISQARERAQNAMERIVSVTSGAVTTDDSLTTFGITSKESESAGLRFRSIQTVDAAEETIEYSPNNTYIYGPDESVSKNKGLVIVRGSTLSEAESLVAGPGGYFGTTDDRVEYLESCYSPEAKLAIINPESAVEVLIPDRFQPRSGRMFSVATDSVSGGRLITYTIRVNIEGPDQSPLLAKDIVVTQRIALRQ